MKIYCTARNPASATVRFEDDASQPLNGSIRGPFCKFARTLPTTIPIRDGQALVVDPCYWTPKLPFRYEVTIDDSRGPAEQRQFMWGIRWCVPHRRNLFVDGKGYVVRAASWDDRFELEAFRELSCSVIVDRPLEQSIFQRASELGVLIVDKAGMERSASDTKSTEYTLESSVHFVPSPSNSDLAKTCDALSMTGPQDPTAPSVSGDVLLVEDSLVKAGGVKHINSPVLVERRGDYADLADMRRACDRLQSDLAPFGQFAGYLISAQ